MVCPLTFVLLSNKVEDVLPLNGLLDDVVEEFFDFKQGLFGVLWAYLRIT